MTSITPPGSAGPQSNEIATWSAESSDTELIDLVQESLIVFSRDGRIIRWNKASERIYGWSRMEVEGRLFADVLGSLPWEDPGEMQSLERAGSRTAEIRRKTSSGQNVILCTKLSMRRVDRGDMIEFVETGIDVTAQRQIDNIAESERRHYRNVFQAIPASVWDIDFSEARAIVLKWLETADVSPREWLAKRPDRVRELMRSTYARNVNEQALRLFGPCERQSLLVSVERYWPDESLGVFTDWIASSLAGESFFSRETRQRRYDGEEFDALFTASYAPGTVGEGKLVVSIVDYSDVKRGQAAIRKSEAFYSDIFHGPAFAAFHLDATRTWALYQELYDRGVTNLRTHLAENPGFIDQVMDGIRVVDVNDQSVKLFEAGDRNMLIGGSIAPLWFPDHRRETLIQSLEGAFNGVATYQGLGRMRTLLNNEIHVLFTRSASIALSSSGQVLLTIVDMTDKVQAQNALAEMQANFAHADRISSLGELTASIAHEVNQPLAAITTNGEASLRWLERSPPDLGRVRSSIDDMIADACRASDIVAHIRSMASPQVGQHQPLSLNQLAEDALELLRTQLQKCDTLTTLELQSDLQPVLGNSTQLQQVIVNLILNALQAMAGQPGSHLTLRTQGTREYVTLIVQDNGPGIQIDDAERLFDSFYTTKPDGMGIGLAICRTLVEAHGGKISAKQLSSRGARFTVSLPSASQA